jgi:hypothetical protein
MQNVDRKKPSGAFGNWRWIDLQHDLDRRVDSNAMQFRDACNCLLFSTQYPLDSGYQEPPIVFVASQAA